MKRHLVLIFLESSFGQPQLDLKKKYLVDYYTNVDV